MHCSFSVERSQCFSHRHAQFRARINVFPNVLITSQPMHWKTITLMTVIYFLSLAFLRMKRFCPFKSMHFRGSHFTHWWRGFLACQHLIGEYLDLGSGCASYSSCWVPVNPGKTWVEFQASGFSLAYWLLWASGRQNLQMESLYPSPILSQIKWKQVNNSLNKNPSSSEPE